MNESRDCIILGRFGRPHGVKGYISVYSFTEPKENILSYADWYVRINGVWTLLKRKAAEAHARCIVALLEGYTDRDKVGELTNLDIAVEANQLPVLAPGEFYWHQLQGMTVINTKGETLGEVTEIIATGSNDVLVVSGQSRQLIPFRYGVVVLDVSTESQQITVDWDSDYL